MVGPTRNFLFAAEHEDRALARLLARAREVTGFLSGTPGPPLPGWYRIGGDNHALLATLHARLRASYPEAGQPFYAARLWTNLTWQPAYLAVLAVHVHGALPRLDTMTQNLSGHFISGFRLPPGPQDRQERDILVARAGAQLRAMGTTILADINRITGLKPLPAWRLLADRLLDLMVRLAEYAPQMGLDERRHLAGLWLDSVNLTGQGALETLTLADGRQVLVVARKGCCLDYLAFPGCYCASCPKQDTPLRHARQSALVTA